jgi:hypothetical protein
MCVGNISQYAKNKKIEVLVKPYIYRGGGEEGRMKENELIER